MKLADWTEERWQADGTAGPSLAEAQRAIPPILTEAGTPELDSFGLYLTDTGEGARVLVATELGMWDFRPGSRGALEGTFHAWHAVRDLRLSVQRSGSFEGTGGGLAWRLACEVPEFDTGELRVGTWALPFARTCLKMIAGADKPPVSAAI
jgi:hypothetical protein